MKALHAAAIATVAFTTTFGSLSAEEYPSQPIEVVTHASAGGGTDTTARTMLIRARRELGVDAFVQIKKGGAGTVAMNYAARKPADGYTLMAITPTHLITIARGKSPISIDQIRGVVRSTDDPIIVVVNKATGITNIQDLIAASETSSIKWGGTQAGGIDHIAAMTFAKNANAKITYVPFDGGGGIITNLMGQNIQAAGLNYGELVGGLESGDFVPLAIMAPTRLGVLPDVPTLQELGIENVNFSTVRGIVVMADTPDERVAFLEEKLLKAMGHGTYQAYLAGIGLDPSSVAGAEIWDAQIHEMYDNISVTLKDLGLVD